MLKPSEQKFTTLGRIAQQSLQACFVDGKIVASPGHFSDFWARDTFFALPGMLVVGEQHCAKECLSYFLHLQRQDGKIPRKLSRDINVIKYLTGKSIMRARPRPTYHGLVKPFLVMDSDFLLIIAMEEYLHATRDYDFAQTHYMRLRKVMMWHISQAKAHDGFVTEYFLGNWMDTIFKFGSVLYTNVLYVRALESMVMIAQIAGRDDEAELFVSYAQKVRRKIRDIFWRETFFVDELRLPDRGTFDLAGNVLAVVYGIANTAQKESVISKIIDYKKEYGSWLPVVPTGHKWWKVNGVVRMIGISDYHTDVSWSWIMGFVAQILHDAGYIAYADEIFDALEAVAIRDGAIGETYFLDGKPYKKKLWKSASPFAWGSGVILQALVHCEYKSKAHISKKESRVC